MMNQLWIMLAAGLGLSFFFLFPLGHKWELNKRVTTPVIILIGLFSGLLVWSVDNWVLNLHPLIALLGMTFLVGVTSISLILWRFFRDPERISPESPNVIVSPADGVVIYIKEIENGQVPISEKKGAKFELKEFTQCDVLPTGGYLVGIAMSFLDVHVNRAPIPGKVALLKRISGLFLSLKEKKAILTNERALVVIDNGLYKIGLVQIASRLVRKIVAYVKEDEDVFKGQRIGMIKFGSQVDVVIPHLPELSFKVQVGDYVYAGESTLVTLNSEALKPAPVTAPEATAPAVP